MSVQFLIRGTHDDGTTGLVSVSEKEWLEIIKQNAELPKAERRYFYRDLIYDNNTPDYIFMEVSRDTLLEWNNQDNAHYRNLSLQGTFSFVSLDELIAEGSVELTSTELVEESVISKVSLDNIRTFLKNRDAWMSDLLDLYLSGDEKIAITHLMEHYNFGRSTAFTNKQRFEKLIKKFL